MQRHPQPRPPHNSPQQPSPGPRMAPWGGGGYQDTHPPPTGGGGWGAHTVMGLDRISQKRACSAPMAGSNPSRVPKKGSIPRNLEPRAKLPRIRRPPTLTSKLGGGLGRMHTVHIAAIFTRQRHTFRRCAGTLTDGQAGGPRMHHQNSHRPSKLKSAG